MEMPVTNHALYSVQRHIRGFHFFSVEVILNASDYFPSITITTLLRHLEEEQKEDRMSRRTTKPKKCYVRSVKAQISLGIRPVLSESSLCTR